MATLQRFPRLWLTMVACKSARPSQIYRLMWSMVLPLCPVCSSRYQWEKTSTEDEESRSGGQIYVKAGAPSLEKACNHLEEIFVINYRRWEVWSVVDRQSRRGHLAAVEYRSVWSDRPIVESWCSPQAKKKLGRVHQSVGDKIWTSRPYHIFYFENFGRSGCLFQLVRSW